MERDDDVCCEKTKRPRESSTRFVSFLRMTKIHTNAVIGALVQKRKILLLLFAIIDDRQTATADLFRRRCDCADLVDRHTRALERVGNRYRLVLVAGLKMFMRHPRSRRLLRRKANCCLENTQEKGARELHCKAMFRLYDESQYVTGWDPEDTSEETIVDLVKDDPRVWHLWIFLETPRDNRFLLKEYRKYATEYIAEGRYTSIYKRNGAASPRDAKIENQRETILAQSQDNENLSKENKKLKAKLRKITKAVNDTGSDSDTDDST